MSGGSLFKMPFTAIVAGPTGSGKTTWLIKLLTQADMLFTAQIDRLVYCYGKYLDSSFKILKQKYNFLETYEGIPDLQFDKQLNNVIIFDDLINEISKNEQISDYFTKGSHHDNLSIFVLTQNLFFKSPIIRTINLNAHYIIIFKNPRDSQQIQYLGNQIYGSKSRILRDIYNLACDNVPHGYIMLDFKQTTPADFRIKTNILHEPSIFLGDKLKPEEFIIFKQI